MIITPTETFLGALAFAGAAGARRGWNREVITSAIVLSDVLFLSNGGGSFLVNLFGGALGTAGSATSFGGPLFAGGGGGGVGPASAPSGSYAYTSTSACLAGLTHTISNFTFITLSWLGYRAGTRYGPAPKASGHRVAGVVPGAVNGAAMAYYVSNNILPGTPVLFNTPGGFDTSSYLPVVFGVGLGALLIVLFVAGQMKKAAGGK